MAGAADDDRHDLGVGLGGDLGDRAVEAERLGVGLDVVGKIHGEPAVALELAHQPARLTNTCLALKTMVRASVRNGSSQTAFAE